MGKNCGKSLFEASGAGLWSVIIRSLFGERPDFDGKENQAEKSVDTKNKS